MQQPDDPGGATMRAPWLERVGDALDILLNVLLLNGRSGQTISLHAAEAQRAGRRWGCVLCRVLDVVVERDHCWRQFAPDIESRAAYARAGAALLLLCAVLWGLAHGALRLAWLLI